MLSKTKCIAVLIGIALLVFGLMPAAAQSTPTPSPLAALAKPGSYQVGVRIMKLTDPSRDNRELDTYVWYPALVTKTGPRPYAPDNSGGPYPLIIYSHGYTGDPTESISVFINHLVSQGFVVAGVNHKDSNDVGAAMVNRPLDVLFLLNQLAALKDDPLAGVIDTDKVGLVGYSAGTYTVLQAAGAQVDLASLPAWCQTDVAKTEPNFCAWLRPYWDSMTAYHDQLLPPAVDNIWPQNTDKRIQAVALFAPCFGEFMGEKGLEAMTLPTMIFAGKSDSTCPYDVDTSFIYPHLGSSDRYLLTLEGRTHGTVLDHQVIEPYLSAFFGLYLQGNADDAQYLTPDTASAFHNVTLDAQVGKSS